MPINKPVGLPHLKDADFENYSKYFPEYRWVRFQYMIRVMYLLASISLFVYAVPDIIDDYLFMQTSFQTQALVIKKEVRYDKKSESSKEPQYMMYIQYYDKVTGTLGYSRSVDKSYWDFYSNYQEVHVYISNNFTDFRLYDEVWEVQYVAALLFAICFFYLYLIFPWLVKIQRESIFK